MKKIIESLKRYAAKRDAWTFIDVVPRAADKAMIIWLN